MKLAWSSINFWQSCCKSSFFLYNAWQSGMTIVVKLYYVEKESCIDTKLLYIFNTAKIGRQFDKQVVCGIVCIMLNPLPSFKTCTAIPDKVLQVSFIKQCKLYVDLKNRAVPY